MNNVEKEYKAVIFSLSDVQYVELLERSRNALVNIKDEHEQLSKGFISYLEHTRTSESLAKLSFFTKTKDNFCSLLETAMLDIDSRIQSFVIGSVGHKSDVKSVHSHETGSHSRVQSWHSNRSENSSAESSLDSAMRLQRAKAEAARAMLDIAKEEAEILKQRAELDARLHILSSKKQVNEAEAELKVLCEEVDEYSAHSGNHLCAAEIKKDRTLSFVEDQRLRHSFRVSPVRVNCEVHQPLNPDAAVFNPRNGSLNNKVLHSCTDVTKFMLKMELSLNRLSSFDDKLEMYNVWKAGFCDVVRDLKLSPNEELYLLIKYLGMKSKKQAVSIRAANANYPQRAIDHVWEWLEERFDSPELVEASVRKWLADIPKIGN